MSEFELRPHRWVLGLNNPGENNRGQNNYGQNNFKFNIATLPQNIIQKIVIYIPHCKPIQVLHDACKM